MEWKGYSITKQKPSSARGSFVSFSANSKLAPILGHARRFIRRLRHILNIVHELIIRCEEGNKIIIYIGCILKVKCHQCGNIYLAFAYITACIWGPWAMGAPTSGALILEVMYNIPVFCVVQNWCFLCCTKLLFSVMYNIPDFSVVQYSCFL